MTQTKDRRWLQPLLGLDSNTLSSTKYYYITIVLSSTIVILLDSNTLRSKFYIHYDYANYIHYDYVCVPVIFHEVSFVT